MSEHAPLDPARGQAARTGRKQAAVVAQDAIRACPEGERPGVLVSTSAIGARSQAWRELSRTRPPLQCVQCFARGPRTAGRYAHWTGLLGCSVCTIAVPGSRVSRHRARLCVLVPARGPCAGP